MQLKIEMEEGEIREQVLEKPGKETETNFRTTQICSLFCVHLLMYAFEPLKNNF
jgi:hypothetical protein